MVTHFPDDHEARAAVDPVLRAWEPSAFLERHRIAFRFRDAEVLDRNPPKVDIALTTVWALRGAGLRRTVRPSAVRNITLFPSA
jgi:hypothetical protein